MSNLWQKLKRVARKAVSVNSTSPRLVLEAIMERGISFYDYDNLGDQDKLNYYTDIQKVLQNEAFQNELNGLIADMIQEVATSEDERHRDKMLRFSINGLAVFKERLESIQDPREKEATKESVNDVI